MILLALLLIAVAVALVTLAVVEGSASVTVEAFDRSIDTSLSGVFAAGVVTGLIALAGSILFVAGIRRSRARRREIEYLRRKVAQQERDTAPDEVSDDAPARNWIDEGAPQNRPATPGHAHNAAWTPDVPADAHAARPRV